MCVCVCESRLYFLSSDALKSEIRVEIELGVLPTLTLCTTTPSKIPCLTFLPKKPEHSLTYFDHGSST